MPIADRPVTQQAQDVAQAADRAIPPGLFEQLLAAEDRLARTTFDPERFFLQREIPRLEAAYRASTAPSRRRFDAEVELAQATAAQAAAIATRGDVTAATRRLAKAQVRAAAASAEESAAIQVQRDERAAAAAPFTAKKLALFALLTAPAWGLYLWMRR